MHMSTWYHSAGTGAIDREEASAYAGPSPSAAGAVSLHSDALV